MSSSSVHPPQWMQFDTDPDIADLARKRLAPRQSILSLFDSKSRRVQDQDPQGSTSPSTQLEDDWALITSVPQRDESHDFVVLDGSAVSPDDNTKDIYRWAIVYENQRGLTFFSTPYYSHMSLLPFDPPAFTLADADTTNQLFAPKTLQPVISLTSYPLPDGNWRWVSKSWMIDMRGDAQVQYDGFQYNSLFRKSDWRSNIGTLSTGAWVRRRRWVRLMVKPAKPISHTPHETSSQPGTQLASPAIPHSPWRTCSVASSHPPSVLDLISEKTGTAIWGGNVEDDWLRCRNYLKSMSTDGKKLEAWKQWLGTEVQKQRAEDQEPMPSEKQKAAVPATLPPPIEFVKSVIREHIEEILSAFIYPDSRAQFLSVLEEAGARGGNSSSTF